MIEDLVIRNRSYRRFDESQRISEQALRKWVGLARCSASAANIQPLKYILSWTPEKNDLIFPSLSWAGYLPEWEGPEPGERPSGYVVMLADTQISKNVGCDHGIAAQTILLGAAEDGFGGCMFGSIDRDLLRRSLLIPDQYEILLVIALGKPVETVQIEDVGPDGSIKYYRDARQVHHVPKRKLEDIILDL